MVVLWWQRNGHTMSVVLQLWLCMVEGREIADTMLYAVPVSEK